MPVTKLINSKATVKQFTNNDLPFNGASPVIASFYASATTNQTVINLPFSIAATGANANTDIFWLFVDGKKLDLGAGNDYTFTNILADGTSSQVTLNQALLAGTNIQAYKLGYKLESQFLMDNRFVSLFATQTASFQNFVDTTTNIVTSTSTTGTPVAGTFYSTIVGRAAIPDLTQNLKAQMGVERIMTETNYLIQNEFGPNGEQVWGTPNDPYNQIRFVGDWRTFLPNTDGQYVASNGSTNDYAEITFYGTGLNVLVYTDASTRSFVASTDGGAEGANLLTTPYSSILTTRSYSPNQVIQVVKGLTAGIHTVKIRNTNANSFGFYGVELVNESSNVVINSGISYAAGQKLVLASQSSFLYSAPVTGVRGGRVIVYQASDGTIGKAFQAVNAAQANLTSTDHTNEEIVRSYNWREFGASRADDWSVATQVNANLLFTLDDGTTSLMAQNGQPDVIVFGCFSINSTGDFFVLTFVGTGLDVHIETDGSTRAIDTISIDGAASIGSLSKTGGTSPEIRKIVSGLPYGTHTVKFAKTTTGSSICFRKFIVYQPKTPAVPAGAVQIGSYNVMATYVANSTAGFTTIGTGALRKNNSREFNYVEGTGGTIPWQISQSVGSSLSGNDIQGDHLNAQVIYTFFGTGFDYRFASDANRSTSITVSLNGTTLTAANFPTAVFSAYGGGSVAFNSGTGVLNTNGGGSTVCGFSVSSLPLGLYTFKLNNNNSGATQRMDFDGFDIVTPIHSVKSNLFADLQNTLPVGSNCISDDRLITPIRSGAPTQKAWGQAFGITGSYTITSSTFVPIKDMEVTVKVTSGNRLRISWTCGINASTSAPTFQLYMNGVAIGNQTTPGTNSFGVVLSDAFSISVAPGTYTVWLAVEATSGTSISGGSRSLLVEEA